MCGILAYIQATEGYFGADPATIQQALNELRARGPETCELVKYAISETSAQVHLGFTRLAINGLDASGNQPMTETDANGVARIAWICNGEIYNWKAIRNELGLQPTNPSGSDCSILGALWLKLRDESDAAARFFQALDGVFAIVLVDLERGHVLVGRDPYGVRPLFMATRDNDKSVYFASETKAIMPFTAFAKNLTAEQFPPGHFALFKPGQSYFPLLSPKAYHQVPWIKNATLSQPEAEKLVRNALTLAVKKRMLTERPVAALLSGGVDSSLIAALVARELREAGSQQPLRTFSIGFEGSSDLHFARMVATKIGSEHHEILATPDEFFAAIPEVIRAIESYDITTVRASVGNYLVSKAIRAQTDCKVVFNGDGSDEVFGSYLYFKRAPNGEAFEAETTRLLKEISYFDVLRSDRSISTHGLEPRTPFLDARFVAVAKSLPTNYRHPRCTPGETEKYILRSAFVNEDLLPSEVLWRRKEAFSDGVSGQEKSWYQEIADRLAESDLIPKNWEELAAKYSHLPPKTAEAFYYRTLYEKYYGSYNAEKAVPHFWMPRWSGETTDPSARTLSLYNTATATAAATTTAATNTIESPPQAQ